MKKKILIALGILVICITSALVTFAVSNSAENSKKAVPSDYHVGITYDEALQSDKPVVALFYVDWCGYCLKFMPKYSTLSKIYKNKFSFVMLNAEAQENQAMVQDVALTGFPTMYIIDPKYDNRLLINNALYMDLGKVRKEFDRYLNVRKRLDSCDKCTDK